MQANTLDLVTDSNTLDLADAFDEIGDLYSASSPCEAAAIVARTLDTMLLADRIAVYLYDFGEKLMRRVAGNPHDATEPTLALGVGSIGQALLAATEVAQHDPFAKDEAVLVRTVLVRGGFRGAVVVARSDDFTSADARLTDYVADRFADALTT